MAVEIPIDLVKTGGKLIPPGMNLKTDTEPRPPKMEKEVKPEGPVDHTHDLGAGTCKHCGWNNTVDPVEPTQDDWTEFVKSVRMGNLFNKQIDLYEGATKVTFRVLTAEEEDTISNTIKREAASGIYKQSIEVVERFTDLRLAVAVQAILTGTTNYTGPEPDTTTMYEEQLKKVRTACKLEPIYRAVRWQYTRFHAMMGTIQARSVEKSFSAATA